MAATEHIIIAPDLFGWIEWVQPDEISVDRVGCRLALGIGRGLMPEHDELDIGIAISVAACGRAAEKHGSDVWIGSVDRSQLLDKRASPLTGCVHERPSIRLKK